MVVAEATRIVATHKVRAKEEMSLAPTLVNRATGRIVSRIRRSLHSSNRKHQRSLSLKIS